MSNDNNGFIAVHVGAGHHADSQKKNYQRLCREACQKGINTLKSGKSYLEAVVEATKVLEDSPLTNAGFGSNLTSKGNVECDASVMDGSTLNFGAVGAASSIKNPIQLAKRLCESQRTKISHGRIPPSFLAGPGAREWAQEHPELGIEIVDTDDLVSPKAKKIWNHYKRKLENSASFGSAGKIARTEVNPNSNRLDTVGAICVDKAGNIASACSSGGIILKSPGRVGQAGVWACGVWADSGEISVAASTSGCGEHLIKTTLARTLADSLQKNGETGDDFENSSDSVTNVHSIMMNDFVESRFLLGVDQKLGGGIAIKFDKREERGELFWTHSTNSMILGYMNSKETKAKSFTSVLEEQAIGRKVVVEGVSFKL